MSPLKMDLMLLVTMVAWAIPIEDVTFVHYAFMAAGWIQAVGMCFLYLPIGRMLKCLNKSAKVFYNDGFYLDYWFWICSFSQYVLSTLLF